ncbi:MAG TPA: response regulator [Terriglobales bacterium]|nr:response regulator [Terriglobales bacterium]
MTVSRQIVVLCIDDNTTALNIRQMLLQAKGFVVRTATDGLSGLEITDKEPIDAVILDYKMPGMDGEEVAKRLRARHPHIPILLLTGFHGLIPESFFSMVDGFLQKGSPAALLLSEVERLTRASSDTEAEDRRRA